MLFKKSASEKENASWNHGDEKDNPHKINEVPLKKFHIAHKESDHDIENSPHGISNEHEEGDIQEIYIRKASDERSKGPCYGNKPRNEKGPSSFVGEEVMDLVKILFVDELKKRSVFKTTSMVLFPQILTNLVVQHITKERSHIEAYQKRNHIEIIC